MASTLYIQMQTETTPATGSCHATHGEHKITNARRYLAAAPFEFESDAAQHAAWQRAERFYEAARVHDVGNGKPHSQAAVAEEARHVTSHPGTAGPHVSLGVVTRFALAASCPRGASTGRANWQRAVAGHREALGEFMQAHRLDTLPTADMCALRHILCAAVPGNMCPYSKVPSIVRSSLVRSVP
jgi:hypothetical protein